MSYKALSRESMVSLSATLVDPQHVDHQALLADPVGKGLLPLVVGAHDTLLSTHNPGPTPTRLTEIRSREEVVDGRHDDVLRGSHHLLLAVAYLVADADTKERLRALRVKLLPDGLASTQKSYRDQVGQAEMARARLDDDDRALLARIGTVDGANLGQSIAEWFELAAELGRLEDERGGDRSPAAGTVREARNRWIRVMRVLGDALSMQESVSAPVAAILVRLDTAAREAARRAANRASSGNAAADPQDAPDGPDGNPDADEPDGDGADWTLDAADAEGMIADAADAADEDVVSEADADDRDAVTFAESEASA